MNDNKSKVVLQRVGDPSPVTIDQDKCLIRTRQDNQMVDCCAIFNGPHGTALRTYTDEVLVNGEPGSAQWLQSGDEILLPCSTKLEVRAASQYRPFEVKSSVAVAEPCAVPVEVKSERLNAIFGGNDEEEVFHSPFSSDLTDAENSAVAAAVETPAAEGPVESMPQPSLESRMSAIFDTPIGNQASEQIEENTAPVDTTPDVSSAVEEQAAEVPSSNELESVMQRLGVLSTPDPVEPPVAEVTQIDEPVADLTIEPQPAQIAPSFAQEEAQPVQNEYVAEPQTVVEPQASAEPQPNHMSQQLESVFANANPQTPAVPVTPVEEAFAPTPVEPTSVEPTPIEPVSVAPVPPTTPEPVASVAEPNLIAAETQDAPLCEAPQPTAEPSVQESIAAADPLSELPTDLRNQLNDLVSSLELNPQTTEPQNVVEPEASLTEQAFAQPQEPVEVEAPLAQPGLSSNADAYLDSLKENVMPEIETSEPVEAVDPKPVEPTSVADILGSMGMAIPGMDEQETEQPEPATFAPESPVEPAPPTPEPVAVAAPQPVAVPGGGAEDDIQAYMDRLLNRAPVEAEPTAQDVEAAAIAAAEANAAKQPVKVLSPEEFVPSHKASRHESFNDLREIANTSSRSAIRVSTSKARTESIIVKSALFLLSFAGAILSYQLQMAIPAIAFVGAAFATSYLFYQDYKRREAELGAARAKLKKAR